MSFLRYQSAPEFRWRQPKSWRELEQKRERISGVRVRRAKPDAFLHKAPEDKGAFREFPVAKSADAQLDELTTWRQARLLDVGPRSAAVELENGGRLTLTSLDGFEILIEAEG